MNTSLVMMYEVKNIKTSQTLRNPKWINKWITHTKLERSNRIKESFQV
jgi:hypothetical protein